MFPRGVWAELEPCADRIPGQLQCLPVKPKCPECPLADECKMIGVSVKLNNKKQKELERNRERTERYIALVHMI